MALRTHLVLVPGFAGFDALGQLHYYADLTQRLRALADAPGARGDAVIHYFDNLPTAGVATRAERLRDWLAKRVARGELQGDDRVALVGHSTGGLDIRHLVRELIADPSKPIPVDGAARLVTANDVLGRVRRLVFLSVPQRGTNIADFVRAHGAVRKGVVTSMLGSVTGRDAPGVEWLERVVATWVPEQADVDLLQAVKDAVAEMTFARHDGATRVAQAQEARAEVELWLRHIFKDFSAIDDLAASVPESGDKRPPPPSRLDDAGRKQELDDWGKHRIRTRSYATVGRRPFPFASGKARPLWNPLWPGAMNELRTAARDHPEMDLAYLLAYSACAGGPFALPGAAPGGAVVAKATPLVGGPPRDVEVWDNDGIVNTASMLWPDGEATRLVDGDHGDVIGHFRRVKQVPPSPRTYHTYDLLRSGSGFDEGVLNDVWRGVFEFCTGPDDA